MARQLWPSARRNRMRGDHQGVVGSDAAGGRLGRKGPVGGGPGTVWRPRVPRKSGLLGREDKGHSNLLASLGWRRLDNPEDYSLETAVYQTKTRMKSDGVPFWGQTSFIPKCEQKRLSQ